MADDPPALDLDFVDPPLLPGMTLYEPIIGPDDAARELHSVAAFLRDEQAWGPEDTERLTGGMKDPAVGKVYAAGVPFVARFITVELDTENKGIAKGIGRIVPADPPPRFGDKYRRRLKSAEARREAETIVEQLMFRGFACGAAANAVDRDPAALIDVETLDWWRRFVGGIAPNYGGLVESGAMELDATKSEIAAIALVISAPTLNRYAVFAEEHGLGKGLNPFGGARVATYPFYFLAAGWSLYWAHTDQKRGA